MEPVPASPPPPTSRGRLLVFVDALFWRQGDVFYNSRAFTLFAAAFVPDFESVTFLARLNPEPADGPYRVPSGGGVAVEPLPYYPDLYSPARVLAALPGIVGTAWRAVGRADTVWLCIPHPLALLLWLFARLRGRRVFFMVRQNIVQQVSFRARGRLSLPARLAVSLLEKVFVRLARRTLTFTVGGEMRRRYAAPGAPVVEMLVSLVPAAAVEAARPRALGLAPRPHCVLWVGRMEPEKGLETLVEAVEILAGRGLEELRADLVGTGRVEPELKRLVRERGLERRVHFTGYVPFGPQLEAFYHRATLLALPSYIEGFPQVLIEAMATGLPVVATSVGGIPLLLRHGEEALVVPPSDPRALAEAMARALSDAQLYARLSESALSFARRHTLEAERQRMLDRIDAWIRSGA